MCNIGHTSESFFQRPLVFYKYFLPFKHHSFYMEITVASEPLWFGVLDVSYTYFSVLSGVRTDILLGDSVTIS